MRRHRTEGHLKSGGFVTFLVTLALRKEGGEYNKTYPPGNQHIPPWEKENHLQNAIFGGYVSSLEGNAFLKQVVWLFLVCF